MSQFFVASSGGGGILPPDVPLNFITDLVDLTIPTAPTGLGSVVPQANTLRVFGGAGIITYETGHAGDLFITFIRVKGTTIGATTLTATFNTAGNDNATFTFQVLVAGFGDDGSGVGSYGSLVCKNVAGIASIVGQNSDNIDLIIKNDTSLNGVNVTVTTSGALVQINCIGIVGRTIDWEISFPGIAAAPTPF
ncbi:MAG: hypothetical protein WB562_04620 [Candidatus Sulfotelmatobacter sp.]